VLIIFIIVFIFNEPFYRKIMYDETLYKINNEVKAKDG